MGCGVGGEGVVLGRVGGGWGGVLNIGAEGLQMLKGLLSTGAVWNTLKEMENKSQKHF